MQEDQTYNKPQVVYDNLYHMISILLQHAPGNDGWTLIPQATWAKIILQLLKYGNYKIIIIAN